MYLIEFCTSFDDEIYLYCRILDVFLKEKGCLEEWDAKMLLILVSRYNLIIFSVFSNVCCRCIA